MEPIAPMALHLLLDSADVNAWDAWLPTGLFAGVTTNPTLLKRAAQPCRLEHLQGLADLALAHGVQELHLQAWGSDWWVAAAPSPRSPRSGSG